MLVSIIIPCRKVSEAFECVDWCQDMDYKDFEIILLPDIWHDVYGDKRKRIIYTGKVLPSHKRDIGIRNARGSVLAFIDADARPEKDWLTGVVYLLKWGEDVVCGAGILPPDSTFMEKVSDKVLQMMPYNYRVVSKPARHVEDYPTFNLIMKKEVAAKVGGFGCDYLTGEDTYICKKIIEAGYKILYSPLCVVYHRRRAAFLPLLRQIATYATHRGFFFKRYPETSRRLVYCLPSLGLLFALSLLIFLLF